MKNIILILGILFLGFYQAPLAHASLHIGNKQALHSNKIATSISTADQAKQKRIFPAWAAILLIAGSISLLVTAIVIGRSRRRKRRAAATVVAPTPRRRRVVVVRPRPNRHRHHHHHRRHR